MTAPLPRPAHAGPFPGLDELQRRRQSLERAHAFAAEPQDIKLGLIARTLQAENDRDHYAERLRDIAAMAKDDTDPFMEMQALAALHELNKPLLVPRKNRDVYVDSSK